jgi:hypothetical protein
VRRGEIGRIYRDSLTHVRGTSATDLWPWAHKSSYGSLP